jgi:hypothetical protein
MRSAAHPRPSRRRVARFAAITAGALAATLTTAVQAQADPCGLPGGSAFDCSKSTPGSSTDGSGDSGTGGGGSSGEIPTLPGQDQVGIGGAIAEPPPPATPTLTLAERARDEAEVPVPTVHTSPEGRTYVRMRTGLWVEGFETVQTDPIRVDGQTIQATATPKSVVWNLGDTTLTCDNPGRPNTTTCSHVYQRSSANQPGGAYRITATVHWGVTWTCSGACDETQGVLGDLSMASAPTPLIVDEIQTNTRP